MDNRAQIREFLTTRRARLTPEQAGVPFYNAGHRRVPGLRREEVAMLSAEPGTPSDDALKLLASWAATQSATSNAR